MPGHFTHIYTARRVADLLASGQFTDWPQQLNAVAHYSPQFCGEVMKEWAKFTAIGAIGPECFPHYQKLTFDARAAYTPDAQIVAPAHLLYLPFVNTWTWETC